MTRTPPGARSPRYEVMFFLEADDSEIETFRRRWEALGDSVDVVGSDGLWNCHIHTDDIGAVVEAGLQAGRPRRIQVTDLYSDMGRLEADLATGGFSPLHQALTAPIGVVAVCEGPGLVERFRQAGAQQVVTGVSVGGAVEGMVEAAEQTAASKVVILPNHPLLVAAAEMVDALTTKDVYVVPTRSVVQGLAAMVAYRFETVEVTSLLDDMAAAAGSVEFGEVVQARRRATVDGWTVHPGDWQGIADGKVVVVDPDRFVVLRGLMAAILPHHPQLVTVFLGEGSSRAESKALEAWLAHNHPDVEVTAVDGGHPYVPYLVAAE